MTTIVTRAGKGSALSYTEMDANLTNLNTDKIEDDSADTLTNKTINLGSNTVTGTKAQFDSACSDGNFAYVSDLSNYQPLDSNLTAIAGLTSAANKVPMFNGAGTATLLDFKDEDNMASDSNTAVPSQQSVKAYADSLRKIIQEVEATPYTTWTAISTVIPIDNSIPQNTEGDEVATVTITPTGATNRLVIDAICEMVNAGSNLDCGMALFQDSTANALAGCIKQLGGSGVYSQIVLTHEMAAGTTSATTFKIRIGPGSGTIYVNGNSSNRIFGGVSAVRLRVREIKV